MAHKTQMGKEGISQLSRKEGKETSIVMQPCFTMVCCQSG